MRTTTVRFGETLYRELQRAAREAGVSVSQYVREATIAFVYWERGIEWGRLQALRELRPDEGGGEPAEG
jgi:hypothetical protein